MWEDKYQVPTVKNNHRYIPLSGLGVFFSARPALGASQGPFPSLQVEAPLTESAVFANGCFRQSQPGRKPARGVVNISLAVEPSIGSALTSIHAHVSTETAEQAESVEVVFDPSSTTDGSIAPHLLFRCA